MVNVLSGITVIDITQNVAGPFCSQLLGDLGATVIKIERPVHGDDTRHWHPPLWGEESSTFLALNRNKKSVCVDLNDPKGQQIIHELCKKADIFIHSLKPGSEESRNLDYETLKEINPSLIYASISAFGDKGKMKHKPGYDPLIQAYSGIMSLTGHEGEDPVRVGVSIVDMATGMWCLIGILSALHERNKTGKGSKVSSSLLETGIAWVTLQMSTYLASGKLPRKWGTGMSTTVPYQAFKTKGGQWAIIAAGNNRLFKNLCTALQMPELVEDPRFETNADRVRHRDELRKLIEERTVRYELDELVDLMEKHSVPCCPINTLDRVLNDEQVNALEIIKKIEGFRVKDFRIIDLPFRINDERGQLQSLPPLLGEHTEEVLASLNMTEDELEQLKSASVVG
ncbi:CaiB/BaiF CoA-transferase family protein [Ureibacillus sp. FSL K6-8385]|uniref:CoA transferase n=1 Tax=Ureibacillus terrenus TaxID=118246 RepID=A0A540V3P0_9BACL|nr:CaiB/BaiF CoA-transferase family protein [Ureibacillus terrenus]MED3661855.1 CaiB/BaiF CoA-transferase family protein [Ureibacillus terrenus]MED3763156.1 CaiB/BaiF CoA-transferase family protein [Ureibacillus terrenus]TQE91338.1 CoA transferase [Ureibacillus terrenus]